MNMNKLQVLSTVCSLVGVTAGIAGGIITKKMTDITITQKVAEELAKQTNK